MGAREAKYRHTPIGQKSGARQVFSNSATLPPGRNAPPHFRYFQPPTEFQNRMDPDNLEPGAGVHENQPRLQALLRRDLCRKVPRCPRAQAAPAIQFEKP
jgi:hypothetical protein